MPTAMIVVSTESAFTFDLDEFARTIRSRWPDAMFVPASARLATVTRGQWQIPHHDAYPNMVLVEFDIEGRGLMFDSPEDELRAEVIATATTVPGFPDDGTVILAQWAADFIPLHPGTTRDELLARVG